MTIIERIHDKNVRKNHQINPVTKIDKIMASLGRIELPTFRLGGGYSILLSYKDNQIHYNTLITKKKDYLK